MPLFPGPWQRYTLDELSSWISANVIDADGTEHAVPADYEDITTYTDGVNEHGGPFSSDPASLGYTLTTRRVGVSFRLALADIAPFLQFTYDLVANAPPNWSGDVEFLLDDGTLVTDPSTVDPLIFFLADEPIELYIGPGIRPLVADSAETPYADSEYATVRAANSLDVTRSGAVTVTSFSIPSSFAIVAGSSPPPGIFQGPVPWVDDGDATMTFHVHVVGPDFTGHYANGYYGLQAIVGFISYFSSFGSPAMGTGSAPSPRGSGGGWVAWRVHYRPPRFRYMLTIEPPQRQFPRDDGLAISTRRSWPPPTSKQFGLRRGPNATYQ